MKPKKNKLPPQPNTKPHLKVMRDGQICPDGVVINVNWDDFVVGSSIFIPAINLATLNKQVQTLANDRNFKLQAAERIEAGKLGMRFWRIV
jgi:hypothetical protein